jgi:uncharacterized protein
MPDATLVGEAFLVILCLAIGGVLKGATGAGAPILAVPAIAAMFDVRFAIVVMCMPNLLTNLWQAWRFRENLPPRAFTLPFVAGGMAGVLAGTLLLASVPAEKLSILVAVAVVGYIALRLARPDWKIQQRQAERLALPAGIAGGFLQGAAGMSAPVSLTFLNAVRLERVTFIAVISLFFTTFGAVQIAALVAARLLTRTELAYSFLALVPIWAAMPLGSWLGKRLPPAAFDRFILAVLSALALKLVIDALL